MAAILRYHRWQPQADLTVNVSKANTIILIFPCLCGRQPLAFRNKIPPHKNKIINIMGWITQQIKKERGGKT
jgi:hypothetical protein